VEQAIKGIQKVGLKYVSIKESHLPLKSTAEERKAVGQKFRDAGITPLSCGVVYLPKDEAGIRNAFEYTRDLGVPTMVCSFLPEVLPLLEPYVKEFNIRLAIHNHGPGDKNFPTPDDVFKAVSSHDERIGLCIDVGHTLRAGVDPATAIRACKSRLYDMHLKDVNQAAAKGSPVEGGRGVLDLKSVFKALLDINYPYQAEFEYEKDQADPLAGLAETVGYCKGLVASL
jgi:sugar phosphate isomerase/epimerase